MGSNDDETKVLSQEETKTQSPPKSSKKAKKKKDKKRKRESEPEVVEDKIDSEEAKRLRKLAKKQRKAEKKKKKKLEKSANDSEEDAPPTSGDSPSTNTASTTYTSSLTQQEVDTFREENKIELRRIEDEEVSKNKKFYPVVTLSTAKQLFDPVVHEMFDLATKGFVKPTPIQAQAWPIVLSNHDFIGIAATGSGKTLAFALPALSKMLKGELGPKSPGCPRALVLAPTRELAIQSAQVASLVCEKATKNKLQSYVVYGGQAKYTQREALKKGTGVDFLVATPGRLLDFVEENTVSLTNVRYLVLDEADRMLDMGFEKDVRRIIAMTASSEQGRQTVMFSATWPKEIRSLAHEFLHRPTRIIIGSANLHASKTVKQIVEVVDPRDKDRKLLALLNKVHNGKNRVIVFGLYKKECARMETMLIGKGYHAVAIHGDKNQGARESAVAAFKSGESPILVATDVAARGLDIKGVEYVINYSFPLTVEDYVHRIGRTGRAGATGEAYTFFTQGDKGLSGALQNVLRQAGAPIPEALAKFGNTVKKKEHKLYGAHFKAIEPGAKAKHVTFD